MSLFLTVAILFIVTLVFLFCSKIFVGGLSWDTTKGEFSWSVGGRRGQFSFGDLSSFNF